MKKVNILGTEYKILVKKYKEDEQFERNFVCGYCNSSAKTITICDMHTYDGWEHEDETTVLNYQKATLRHEIVHAFFEESGLSANSYSCATPWARNEEMVDWIALQGIKIYEAWECVGAI